MEMMGGRGRMSDVVRTHQTCLPCALSLLCPLYPFLLTSFRKKHRRVTAVALWLVILGALGGPDSQPL
eukprot:4829552-Pyramimonas_sp.AAC.1